MDFFRQFRMSLKEMLPVVFFSVEAERFTVFVREFFEPLAFGYDYYRLTGVYIIT